MPAKEHFLETDKVASEHLDAYASENQNIVITLASEISVDNLTDEAVKPEDQDTAYQEVASKLVSKVLDAVVNSRDDDQEPGVLDLDSQSSATESKSQETAYKSQAITSKSPAMQTELSANKSRSPLFQPESPISNHEFVAFEENSDESQNEGNIH